MLALSDANAPTQACFHWHNIRDELVSLSLRPMYRGIPGLQPPLPQDRHDRLYQPDAFRILVCLATVLDECPPHSLSLPPCGNGQSTLILKSVPVASFTRHWHAFIYCAGLRFTWLSYPRVRGRDELVLARAFVPAETVVVSGPWLTARVTLANIPRMALSCFAPDHPPCLLFIIPAAATDGVEGYSIAARSQSVLEALSSVYPLCSGEGESNLRSMSLYSAFGVCP